MRPSLIVAGVLAAGATAWILSGQIGNGKPPATAKAVVAAKQPDAGESLFAVRVRVLKPSPHQRLVTINGRTEESRSVTVRAETGGPIDEIAVEEGRLVEAGQVIARQAVEDRRALLAEARALEKQRDAEYRAAAALAKKGFRSETKLAEAQALLEAAQARTETMKLDLARTTIKAPFAGMLETRFVEKGDYVQKGGQIATIVDLDPILAVGYVSERNVGAVTVGAPGAVKLIDGSTVRGTVRYVGSVADASTRSFRIEIEIPNADRRIRAGVTGELVLPSSTVEAYLISPAWLTLADDGKIGVRIVDDGGIVRFVPVGLVASAPDGTWVTGIPEGARLITVGQEFVKAGQKVRPVVETPDTAS